MRANPTCRPSWCRPTVRAAARTCPRPSRASGQSPVGLARQEGPDRVEVQARRVVVELVAVGELASHGSSCEDEARLVLQERDERGVVEVARPAGSIASSRSATARNPGSAPQSPRRPTPRSGRPWPSAPSGTPARTRGPASAARAGPGPSSSRTPPRSASRTFAGSTPALAARTNASPPPRPRTRSRAGCRPSLPVRRRTDRRARSSSPWPRTAAAPARRRRPARPPRSTGSRPRRRPGRRRPGRRASQTSLAASRWANARGADRVDRAHVDHERTCRHAVGHPGLAEQHELDVRRVGHHRDDDVGRGCDLGRGGGPRRRPRRRARPPAAPNANAR